MTKRRKKEWFDDDAMWRDLYPYLFPPERFEQAVEQVRQILDLDKRRPRGLVDAVGNHHLGAGAHLKGPGGGDQPLAEVAVTVGDKYVARLGYHHVRGPIEMTFIITGCARHAEREEQLRELGYIR